MAAAMAEKRSDGGTRYRSVRFPSSQWRASSRAVEHGAGTETRSPGCNLPGSVIDALPPAAFLEFLSAAAGTRVVSADLGFAYDR